MSEYRQGKAERILPEAMRRVAPLLRQSIFLEQEGEIAKEDGSLATCVDSASESNILEFLDGHLSIPVIAEEGGRIGAYTGKNRVVLVDPQDGTASGRIRSTTATVGASVYNPLTKEFEVATVVDPFGGRLWYTEGGETYRQAIDVHTARLMGEAVVVRTSSKAFDEGGEILLDNLHGFIRKDVFTNEKRQVMTLREKMTMIEAVHERCGKIRSASSNLHHQALVADGGDAIGAIASALGGPWDLTGIKLVLNAGGEATYLRRDNMTFEITDDPLEADIAIAANTKNTLHRLVGAVASITSLHEGY